MKLKLTISGNNNKQSHFAHISIFGMQINRTLIKYNRISIHFTTQNHTIIE